MATAITCSRASEERRAESVTKTFATTIRNDDFIVRDHRVHGVRVLPGVTFIDLIYRSLAGTGIDTRQIALQNLLFKEPVVTSEDYDRALDISVAPYGDIHRVNITSTPVKGNNLVADQRREVFRCDLLLHNSQPAESISLQHVISQAVRKHDAARIYDGARTLGIHHFEFMTSHGSVYEGRDFGLAEVYLSDLAKEYLEHFHIHPVYMDVATGMPLFMRSCAGSIAGKAYIPLHIHSFTAVRPLTDPTFVYIRKPTDERFGDVITEDLELYAKDGGLCARITKLTLKEVRTDQLITSLVAKVQAKPVPTISAVAQPVKVEATATPPTFTPAATPTAEAVVEALKSLTAAAVHKDPSEISEEAKFYDQGFESKELLETVAALERALGRQMYPTLLFEYGSIRELAAYLLQEHADVVTGLAKPVKPAASTVPSQETPSKPDQGVSIVQQLRQMIASLIGSQPEAVSVEASFYDLGLDSANLSGLVAELESRIGRQLYPTLLFEYSNIRELAQYLANTSAAPIQKIERAPEVTKRITEQSDASLAIYSPKWVEAQHTVSRDLRCAPGCLVVLDYDPVLADGISARRREAGLDSAILVTPGQSFRAVSPRHFEIRPDDQNDYELLFLAIGKTETQRVSVLHVWGLKATTPACVDDVKTRIEAVRIAIRNGLIGIGSLTRAAHAAKLHKGLSLTCFVDPRRAENTGLAGFFRTVAQEFPSFDYQLVGWDAPAPEASDIIAATNHAHSADRNTSRYFVCRDGKYYSREIAPASETAGRDQDQVIRRGGTYLITGGLGGVGLVIAEYLVARYGANLILLGRSPLGETQARKVQRLTNSGSRVRYVQADVSNYEDLRAAIVAATKDDGAINGVIHAAGVIEDALLINKDGASIERVLAPKVVGSIALDEATKDEPLDFFVAFSSLSGVFGNAGQADYAFANSFVDEFVVEREKLRSADRRRGLSRSIAWPLWESGGMQSQKAYESIARFGLVPLPSKHGLEAFEHILRLQVSTALPVYGKREQIAAHLSRQSSNSTSRPAPAISSTPKSVALATPAKNVERRAANAPIAIIGIAGKYAEANTPEELWQALREGRDLVTEIPTERWDHRKYFDPERGRPGKMYSKWGSFIKDADKFDSLFFNISPLEAERMDPQERLMLETAWAAIEDGGYTPENICRATEGETGRNAGVFVGVMWNDYQLFGHEEFLKGNFVLANSWASMIPNRVSYALNFTGPSMPVDTACSSSLVAVHTACESIRNGDCLVALAGGVNLSLHPNKYIRTSQLQMFSSDGKCRSFGEGGDGYVPGEGVGMVLLKALDEAISDGDHIYGIIRGSAVRHGGRTAGFAVPSPAAQADLIASNLKNSAIDARAITYVEAHGTGTSLGDPIEMRGLTSAFRKSTGDRQFCSVGSVKSNLGHLEAAAGVAALTKVLMQFRHQEIAPTLHSKTPNAKIDFANSPFYLQHEVTPWERPTLVVEGEERILPRSAAISSFGAGGVNAHLIVEEYDPSASSRQAAEGPSLLPLSAKTPEALRNSCGQLKQHLERLIADSHRLRKPGEAPPVPLPDIRDISYTLQIGRAHLDERLIVLASSCAEAVERLGAFLDGHKSADVFAGSAKTGGAIADVLKDGEESREFVKRLAAGRALSKLSRLWVGGVPINWSVLHDGQRYRVPLPAYPFARERHWLSSVPEANAESSRIEQIDPEPVKEEKENTVLFREPFVASGSDELDIVELIRPYNAHPAARATVWQTNTGACLSGGYETYLTDLVASELKLAPERVDPTEPVLNYGVDSLVLMKLRNSMEERFGELPVMLFFEYKTIRELSEYLVTTQPVTNAYTDDIRNFTSQGAD